VGGTLGDCTAAFVIDLGGGDASVSKQFGSERPVNRALETPIAASNRNPLDDVAGDFPVAPVVEAGCPRVGVAGEPLYVVEKHTLLV